MTDSDDDVVYEYVDSEEIQGFSDRFKDDHVYISFGMSPENRPAIEIIDLTQEGSAAEQIFLPIAHTFVDHVLNNITEAQRMGIQIMTELDENATEH